eukprot:10698606-Lingulodinium_polyedra.AAC.1
MRGGRATQLRGALGVRIPAAGAEGGAVAVGALSWPAAGTAANGAASAGEGRRPLRPLPLPAFC